MPSPVRLAKRLVELTSCSRREAELYIAGGWVSVDGQVVEEPQFMVEGQKVELNPDATPAPIAPVTILFNQSAGCFAPPQSAILAAAQELIRADTRAADDRSGIRLLKRHLFKLAPCLPLERNAGGLVVLTQDWHVSRKLGDDVAAIEQEYVAEVAGEIIPDGLKLLNHGLMFNGKALAPAKVSWQSETRLRFALKGVVPGQVADACRQVGLQVLSMRRLRIGRLAMGKLQPDCWRYLLPYEKF